MPNSPPAADVGEHGHEVLRRLELECARFEHLAGVVQLRRAAVEVLLGFRGHLRRQVEKTGHMPQYVTHVAPGSVTTMGPWPKRSRWRWAAGRYRSAIRAKWSSPPTQGSPNGS